MSTRSIIAYTVPPHHETWVGTYHHFDGYPSGVGNTLWQLYHGHFQRDLPALIKAVITDHTQGWSTINADWDRYPPIPFEEYQELSRRPNGRDLPHMPVYYRDMQALTEADLPETWAEWLYVLTATTDLQGQPQARMTIHTVRQHRAIPVAQLDLNGPEPDDWDQLQNDAITQVYGPDDQTVQF